MDGSNSEGEKAITDIYKGWERAKLPPAPKPRPIQRPKSSEVVRTLEQQRRQIFPESTQHLDFRGSVDKSSFTMGDAAKGMGIIAKGK